VDAARTRGERRAKAATDPVLHPQLLATVLTFWKARRGAGLLLAPYLAWVTFASALNCAVWQLNR